MKREILLSPACRAPQLWGYTGEKEHTRIIVELPEDIAACNFYRAKITIKGKLFRTDYLEILDGKVCFELTSAMVETSGIITAQIIGYVVDENGDIDEIGKTEFYRGNIKKSLSGKLTPADSDPSLLDRLLAKVHVLFKNTHSHTNADTLDKFGENASGGLLYNGKDIGGVKSLTSFPETAAEGDVVLLHRCNEISVDDSHSGVLLDIPAIVALGLPEGYEQRVWEITATDPNGGEGFSVTLEIKRIDDYILTGLVLATASIGGRWYWKNGELTTDIAGASTDTVPVHIPLGYVDGFTFTKTLYDLDYWETADTDETVIFRTLPVHYMFLKGEWQLVSPNNEALQKAVEELQRNVGKYTPMTRIETTTTGTSILEPNKMYDFGVVDTLTVVFDEGAADKVNEYLFSFVSGETATVLTLPSSVQWVNELTVEANKRYEISVVDNVALWCAVDYEVTG